MKIAVFGSAFNPPTNSHLKIIEGLQKEFDKVLVVPCYSHNFGKKMIPYEHRLNMARLLVSSLDGVEVSDIESKIFKNETSKTYLLLCALKSLDPTNEYVFVCGEDNADESNWKRFYKYEAIDKEFGKYVIESQGNVRSTLLRERLKNNESISGMTKDEVIDYISGNRIIFE